MRFSYYKTANRTAPCGVVRCGAILLGCGVVMSFCGQFWCGFFGLYGLCSLVNTPSLVVFLMGFGGWHGSGMVVSIAVVVVVAS